MCAAAAAVAVDFEGKWSARRYGIAVLVCGGCWFNCGGAVSTSENDQGERSLSYYPHPSHDDTADTLTHVYTRSHSL